MLICRYTSHAEFDLDMEHKGIATEYHANLAKLIFTHVAPIIRSGNAYVAGGAAKDLMAAVYPTTDPGMRAKLAKYGSTSDDIDIYMRSDDPAKLQLMQDEIESKFKLVNETQISLNYIIETRYMTKKLQLIKPNITDNRASFYGEPDELVSAFDLSACQASLQCTMPECIELRSTSDWEETMTTGIVKLVNQYNPLSGLLRLSKYAAKGFKIQLKSYVNILRYWDDRTDIEKTEFFKLVGKMSEGKQLSNMEYEFALRTTIGMAGMLKYKELRNESG